MTANVIKPKQFKSRVPARGICACGWRFPKQIIVTHASDGCEVSYTCPCCGTKITIGTKTATDADLK